MNADVPISKELLRRLGSAGLYLTTGPFTVRLQTAIPSVAEGLAKLYADFPLAETAAFADFHVRLERPRNHRRWLKPQVMFRLDGKSPFKPLPLDQAFPMLEWGLNWCVSNHAKSYLILHAAVVEKDGAAAVLPAPPGSGKSTLCAALIHRGWRLLSDELTLIRLADGAVVPLPRPVSLKNQSIDLMQSYLQDGVFSRRVRDTLKGDVAHLKPPLDSVKRADLVARPAWIIFPKYEPGVVPSLTPVLPSQAFMQVAANAFNFSSLGKRGFDVLANTVDASLCYDFRYSRLDDAVATFAALKPKAGSHEN